MGGRPAALAAFCALTLMLFAVPAHAQAPGALDCDGLDPAHCLYPFPSDFFTVPDSSTATGKRLNLPLLGMPRNVAGKPVDPSDMNRADGFSPGSMIITKVPGLDNQEAFQRTNAVPITDIERSLTDEEAPIVVIDADSGERHLIWSEIDSNPTDPEDVTLIIRPAVNFEEGHRYIVALRNLKDADGNAIEARGQFRAWRDQPNDRAGGRRGHFEEIFATLSEAGIERNELYLSWDFTVASEESLAGRMLSIRDRAFAELGDTDLDDLTVQGRSPAFTVESVTDPSDPGVARRVEGTFEVPCFLTGGVRCEPGSRFVIGPDGEPVRAGSPTYRVNFACNVPDSASAANPARPSLYGHGLFGSAGEIGQGQLEAMGNEHNFIFCATDWDGMSSEDLPATLALVVPDLSNFPMLVDRVQQGMLNFLFLGRLMLHPDGFASDPAFQDGGESLVDPERLVYDGNSQGGIIGGALAAVAPDHQHAVLGVPGMNYSTLLRRSVDFVSDPLPEVVMNGGEGAGFSTFFYTYYPNELERPLLLSLVQLLWDRGEANGYAHHMTDDPLPNTPAHQVMLHVGFGDHQVADVSAEVEARTIGALRPYEQMVRPGRHSNLDPYFGIPVAPQLPFGGSAIVVWDTGPIRTLANGRVVGTDTPPTTNTPPTAGQDPHEYPRRQPNAREQKAKFFREGLIYDVCPPDGFCDADPTL